MGLEEENVSPELERESLEIDVDMEGELLELKRETDIHKRLFSLMSEKLFHVKRKRFFDSYQKEEVWFRANALAPHHQKLPWRVIKKESFTLKKFKQTQLRDCYMDMKQKLLELKEDWIGRPISNEDMELFLKSLGNKYRS